jgi:hypothetical protein
MTLRWLRTDAESRESTASFKTCVVRVGEVRKGFRDYYGESSRRFRTRSPVIPVEILAGSTAVGQEPIVERTVQRRPASELSRLFNRLSKKWDRETLHLSSPEDVCLNWSYQCIIGLGPDALPLILSALARNKGAAWHWALAAISGENPVRKEHAGNIEKVSDDWLEWGVSRGYL